MMLSDDSRRMRRWGGPGVWLAWSGLVLLGLPLATSAEDGSWSPLQPLPATVAVPQVQDRQWLWQPVDAFVLHRLEAEGWRPAADASRRQWLRRVTFDLTGLPPTADQMKAFLADPRNEAVACGEVVDRLLASPAYGERWGRHWLDVVRYGDTDGFAIDGERPTLWRYRDYVVRAFNDGRAFDDLIREQLAGDRLAEEIEDPQARSDAIIATGFYRLGPYELDNMTPENRRQDFLNEMTTTIGNAFLAFTIGCARCHDHKYDPIPQADFYRLQAFLAPCDRQDRPAPRTAAENTPALQAARNLAEQEKQRRIAARDAHRELLKQQLAEGLRTPVGAITEQQFERALRGESLPVAAPTGALATVAAPTANAPAGECQPQDDAALPHGQDRPPAPEYFQLDSQALAKLAPLNQAITDYTDDQRFAEVVSSIGAKPDAPPPQVHVLLGGDVFAPGDPVQPGVLSAVAPWSQELQNQIDQASTQVGERRRVLADWIASDDNPLTARVLANRVWQYHFGRGIVATPNDFGVNGAGPSHPELLDYLARCLVRQGWELKPLHRMLVLSRTYRLASTHPAEATYRERDPENRWLWKARVRRLEAEALRDAMLSVSGALHRLPGGPGFYEELPAGMGSAFPFFQWTASEESQRARRSIYMFQRRNLVHPFVESFDGAGMAESCEQRRHSVTVSQAFALMNGKLAWQAARRLVQTLPDATPNATLEGLFQRVHQRRPTPQEEQLCREFLREQTALHAAEPAAESDGNSPQQQAWRDLAITLLSSNEFLYCE